MVRPGLDYTQTDDMQFQTFQNLAVWIEEAAFSWVQKNPKKLLACLEVLYMYIHMRLPDASEVREKMDRARNALYGVGEDKDHLLESRVLNDLYAIACVFTSMMDKEGILLKMKVDPNEIMAHTTV